MNNLWRPKDITIGITMNLKLANIVVPVALTLNLALLESSEKRALTKKFPSSDLPAGKSVEECLDY